MKFISVLTVFAMSLGAAYAVVNQPRTGVIDVAELEKRSGGIRK